MQLSVQDLFHSMSSTPLPKGGGEDREEGEEREQEEEEEEEEKNQLKYK